MNTKTKVIAITNYKGGVGKSTITTNLGFELEKLGYKVLMIDFDGQKNLTAFCGMKKTTATDKVDGGKDLNGNVKQTIVDKVEYKNLYAGKEYTVKGVLMNKATGKPILVDGKEVTAEKVFTPKETSGFVELEFTFDSSALKGETIVVFEHLYEGKVEVAVHADINDKDQSIYIPEITTTATSKDDSGKGLLPLNYVVIEDKVEYKNLIKGQMYQMDGTLISCLITS